MKRFLPLVLLSCASASPDLWLEDDTCGTTSAAVVTDRSIQPAPAPPSTVPSAWVPRPIPVLLFHEICDANCDPANLYWTSRNEFYRIVLMLKSAGYTSISPAQFVAYIRGQWTDLPANPVLITFDDSWLSAYRGVDDILRVTGMRATMFAITGLAEANEPTAMSWNELRAAQASGRWDIQYHGHNGHRKVNGLPFLAYRFPGETLEQWKARAEGDIWDGIRLLHRNIPGYAQHLYAVPFGDYGQKEMVDPEIPVHLKWFYGQRFGAWFTQIGNPEFALANQPTKERSRYTVLNRTTAEMVCDWLQSRELRRAKMVSP